MGRAAATTGNRAYRHRPRGQHRRQSALLLMAEALAGLVRTIHR